MDHDQEASVALEAEAFGVALFTYLFQRRRPKKYIPEMAAGGADEDPEMAAGGADEDPEMAVGGAGEDFFTTDVGEAVLHMCYLHGNWLTQIFIMDFPDGLTDFPTFRSYVSRFAHELHNCNNIFISLLMVSAMIIEMCLYCLKSYAKPGARFASPAGMCWSAIFLDLFAEDFFKFGGWQALQKVSHYKASIFENIKGKYTALLSLELPFVYLVNTVDVMRPEPLTFQFPHEQKIRVKQLIRIGILDSLPQESLDQISESKLEALLQNSHIPFSDHDLDVEIRNHFKELSLHKNKYLRSDALKSSDVTGYAPTSGEELDSNTASKCPSETKSKELGAIPKTAVRSEYSFQKFGTINYTDEKDILQIFKALVNRENADDGKYISQLLCSNETLQILMRDAKYLRLIKETVEKPSNKPDTKQLVEDAKNIIVKASFTAELMSHPPENQPTDIPLESRDNLEQNLDLQNLQKTSSNDDLATSMETLESNIVGKPSSEKNYSVLGAIPKTTIKTREILQTSDNECSLYEYDLLSKFKDIVKKEIENGLHLCKLLSSSGESQLLMNDNQYLNLMKDVVIHKKKPDTKQLLDHARSIIEVPSPEILENKLLENQPHNIASRSEESLVKNQQILEKGNVPLENLNISTPESKSQNPFENKPIEMSSKSEGELLERPNRSEMGKEPSLRQKPEEHVDCDKRNIPEVKRKNTFEKKSTDISFKSGEILQLVKPEMGKEPSPREKPEKHVSIDVDCHKRNIGSARRTLKTKERTESAVNEPRNPSSVTGASYMSQILQHLNSKLGTTFPINDTFEWACIHSQSRGKKTRIMIELLKLSETLTKRIEAYMISLPLSATRMQIEEGLNLGALTREGFRQAIKALGRSKTRWYDPDLPRHYTEMIQDLFQHNEKFYHVLDMQNEEIKRNRLLGGTSSGGASNIKGRKSKSKKPYDCSTSKREMVKKSSNAPSWTTEGASYHPGRISEHPGISSDNDAVRTISIDALIENAEQISCTEEVKTAYKNMLSLMDPLSEKKIDQQLSDDTDASSSDSEGTAGASLDTEQSGRNARNRKKKRKNKNKKRNKRKK